MSAEKKHFIFIAVCCWLLVAPGVLCTGAAGATATVEITARVSLVAYNVTASGITTTDADIKWLTNGVADSTVRYGLTIGYEITPEHNAGKVTSHKITLKNLTANTVYHYMVVSSDQSGNTCESPDFNFTTAGAKSLIVDSGDGEGIFTIGNLVGMPALDFLVPPPALTVVSGNTIPLTAENLVVEPVVIVSGDKSATLSIDESTLVLDQYGQPVSSIDLTRIASKDVPAVPKGSLFVFTGYAYQIEPSGATFSPPVALTITTTPREWELISGQELSIQYYNPVSGLWEALSTTTDPATHSVTTMIAHASDYGLFTRPPSPGLSPATTTGTTKISPPGPVQGVMSGFDWRIVVQGFAIIMTILVVASAGLYLYRKQDRH